MSAESESNKNVVIDDDLLKSLFGPAAAAIMREGGADTATSVNPEELDLPTEESHTGPADTTPAAIPEKLAAPVSKS